MLYTEVSDGGGREADLASAEEGTEGIEAFEIETGSDAASGVVEFKVD